MTGRPGDDDEDEAARWVSRMDAGGWSRTDEAGLQAWFAGDPRRRGTLLRTQAAWLALDDAVREPHRVARDRRMGRRGLLLAAASSGLAASIAGGLFWLGGGLTYRTEVGEIRRVPLADGSIAAINTASKIEVRLSDARRDVQLERGEAWFQVAKDAQRPFVVNAGDARVLAVGTAFAVRRRAEGVEVLVTEGTVLTWEVGGNAPTPLAAGQRVLLAGGAIRHVRGKASDIERALAWRAGQIDLAGDTLGEAVAEFNRYNRRQILFGDPALAAERLDGVFRTDDPEGFARAIEQSLAVAVDYREPFAIRLGRAKG